MRKQPYILLLGLMAGLLLCYVSVMPAYAGDPDEIIGPRDIDLFECLDVLDDDGNKITEPDVVNIDSEREEIRRNSTYDIEADIAALRKACEKKEDGAELFPIAKTEIVGYVYEFHPRDPANPATSEWYAVPSRDVPVVAEGVTFEIFWGSEPDGYFYFYKTRFGQGPIVLNLRLPEDVHPINPNIVIESSGMEETWTVYLGFYRGDVPPPNIEDLRTPDGNSLPFTSSIFDSIDSIVGLDGRSALPGVGGELPQEQSQAVTGLAVTLLLLLSGVGARTILQRQGKSGTKKE